MSNETLEVKIVEDTGSTNKLIASVNSLADASDRVATATEKSAAGTKKLGDSAAKADTDAGKLSKTLGILSTSANGIGSSFGTLSGSLGGVQTLSSSLGSSFTKTAAGVTTLSDSIKTVAPVTDSAAKSVDAATKSTDNFETVTRKNGKTLQIFRGAMADVAPAANAASTAVRSAGTSMSTASTGSNSFEESVRGLNVELGNIAPAATTANTGLRSVIDAQTGVETITRANGKTLTIYSDGLKGIAPAATGTVAPLNSVGGAMDLVGKNGKDFRDRVLDLNRELGTLGTTGAPQAAKATAAVGTAASQAVTPTKALGGAAGASDTTHRGFFGTLGAGLRTLGGYAVSAGQAAAGVQGFSIRAKEGSSVLSTGFNSVIERGIGLITSLGISFATFATVAFVDGVNSANDALKRFLDLSSAEGQAAQKQLSETVVTTGVDYRGLVDVFNIASAATLSAKQSVDGLAGTIDTLAKASLNYGQTQPQTIAGLKALYQSFDENGVATSKLKDVLKEFPGIGAAVATAYGTLAGASANARGYTVATNQAIDAQKVTISGLAATINQVIPQINATSSNMGVSVSKALGVLQQAFSIYASNATNAFGLTQYLAGGLLYLSNNIGIVIGVLAGLAVALSVIALAAFISAIATLAQGVVALVGGLGLLLTLFGLITLPVGIVAAGVIALYGAIIYFNDTIQASADKMGVFSQFAAVMAQSITSVYNWLKAGVVAIIDWVKSLGIFSSAVASVTGFLDKFKVGFTGAATQGDALTAVQKNLAQILNGSGKALNGVTSATEGANGELKQYVGTVGSAGTGSYNLADALKKMQGAQDGVNGSFTTGSGVLNTYVNGMGNLVQAAGNAQQAILTVSDALEKTYARRNQLAGGTDVPGSYSTSYDDFGVKSAVDNSLGGKNSPISAELQGRDGGSFQYIASAYPVTFNGKTVGDFTTGHAGYGAGGLGYLASGKEYLDVSEKAQQFSDELYAKNPKMLTSEAGALIREFIQQTSGTVATLYNSGFATGGSFMVGGSGGTDSQPVGFMASPNERVTIETPQQRMINDNRVMSGGTPTAAQRTRTINNVFNIKSNDEDSFRRTRKQTGQEIVKRINRALG